MADLFPPSLAEQIKCVEREITLRRRIYPGRIAAKRMSQVGAEREIAAMTAVLETLRGLAEPGRAR